MRKQIHEPRRCAGGHGTFATHDPAEAVLDRLLDQQWCMASEVSLTHMPSLQGIACKALYLLECLEEAPGDLATELARSLAKDVLAVTG